MSENIINFIINDTSAQKNGEASSKSSDVVACLDFAELQVLQDDIKKQNQKRVPTIRIIVQYEKFFTRRMANAKQMVRAIEARVEELEASAIDAEYDIDWAAVQSVKPKKINKAVA